MHAIRIALLFAVVLITSEAQRPSFAGFRPIGYPEIETNGPIENRFGEEVPGPIEIRGNRNLMNRFNSEMAIIRFSLAFTLLIITSEAQRPFYAGLRPIGYPEIESNDLIQNRFGEDVPGPIEARGDRNLINSFTQAHSNLALQITMATLNMFVILATIFVLNEAQRPFYAGLRPIGYPETESNDLLGNRFGEDQPGPIEAKGLRAVEKQNTNLAPKTEQLC
ncbi:unnamed protein product, partial [Iphiclides podalirius]